MSINVRFNAKLYLVRDRETRLKLIYLNRNPLNEILKIKSFVLCK